MTKNKRNEYTARKHLQIAGWNTTKATRYNSGSETVAHTICKTLVGHYLHHEHGYNVSFEVVHDDRGEIDVLAWGVPSRINPLAVEVETSPTVETVKDKLERYVDGTPIKECYVLNVNDMPSEIMEAYEWVASQL